MVKITVAEALPEGQQGVAQRVVFRPNLVQRIYGALNFLFGITVSVAVVVTRGSAKPPSGFLVVWLVVMVCVAIGGWVAGFWLRLEVDESVVRIRNLRTIELRRTDVECVTTEYGVASRRLVTYSNNRAFVRMKSGELHNIWLMRRAADFSWIDSLYEERLKDIAKAIGCPYEPAR